jgi:preprotein translocase subunit YajC
MYSQQLAEYWVLILAPFVLLGVFLWFRNYRKQKKDTDEWLKGSITRKKD